MDVGNFFNVDGIGNKKVFPHGSLVQTTLAFSVLFLAASLSNPHLLHLIQRLHVNRDCFIMIKKLNVRKFKTSFILLIARTAVTQQHVVSFACLL